MKIEMKCKCLSEDARFRFSLPDTHTASSHDYTSRRRVVVADEISVKRLKERIKVENSDAHNQV